MDDVFSVVLNQEFERFFVTAYIPGPQDSRVKAAHSRDLSGALQRQASFESLQAAAISQTSCDPTQVDVDLGKFQVRKCELQETQVEPGSVVRDNNGVAIQMVWQVLKILAVDEDLVMLAVVKSN